MLQRCFIDGLFDPALQQFLRLHARTDDFVTTVAKARQYMDAHEQAKITAISKKPNVRLAAMNDPSPDRIQPILDGLQKVLQTVLDNQSRPPVVNVGEQVQGNGGSIKARAKEIVHNYQPSAMLLLVWSTKTLDTRNQNREDVLVRLHRQDHERFSNAAT